MIEHDLLANEEVAITKADLFTRKGDIVIKLSVAYECAYVSREDEGLLIPSFCAIVRKREDCEPLVNMRYLAELLNSPHASERLSLSAEGSAGIRLLRKRDIEDFEVPLPERREQERCARLSENVLQRRRQLVKLMKLDRQLMDARMQNVWCRSESMEREDVIW